MSQKYSDNEQLVINVVQDYLNKNRSLDVGNILPFIRSNFSKASININDNGIKQIIHALIKKNVIVQGSKLIRNEVLKNPNRKEIFQIYIHEIGKPRKNNL